MGCGGNGKRQASTHGSAGMSREGSNSSVQNLWVSSGSSTRSKLCMQFVLVRIADVSKERHRVIKRSCATKLDNDRVVQTSGGVLEQWPDGISSDDLTVLDLLLLGILRYFTSTSGNTLGIVDPDARTRRQDTWRKLTCNPTSGPSRSPFNTSVFVAQPQTRLLRDHVSTSIIHYSRIGRA